jgi:replicative DNA helicase
MKPMEFNISEMESQLTKLFKDPMSLGIPYLNNACPIYKTDLVVVSSHTGLGKTELAAIIAMENAKKSKNVSFFALEAFKFEIETRNIFRIAQQSYNQYLKDNNIFTREYFTYGMYLSRDIPDKLKDFVHDAENYVRVMSKSMRTIYREDSNYTIDSFIKDLSEIDLSTDLVVIDHLHFFDYDETKEYSEISKIVKKLRDLPLITEIPIVLVSHMRKNISKKQVPIPGIDDLHGSSNIAKVASKIIFISPDFKNETGDNINFPTLLRVAKNRYNGQVTRYAGLLNYNVLLNNYSEDYSVCKLNYFENDYEIMENKPGWCQ